MKSKEEQIIHAAIEKIKSQQEEIKNLKKEIEKLKALIKL
jgi:hypothetical protein